ncbi:uncharacterized protein LOC105381524 [Plutella xylostella]|uniref:uncharacterized protein LOC105381524 n=1 Tax=Plutella xylostella TaxID=51655 RepID=UPI0020330D4B|nr:uncharacterized protein LOC105381524 [Plutella xylostella]
MEHSDSMFLFEIAVEELQSFVKSKDFTITCKFADIFELRLKNTNCMFKTWNQPNRKAKSSLQNKTIHEEVQPKVQCGRSVLFEATFPKLIHYLKTCPLELILWSKKYPAQIVGSTCVVWSRSYLEYLNLLAVDLEAAPVTNTGLYNFIDNQFSKCVATVKVKIKLSYLKANIAHPLKPVETEKKEVETEKAVVETEKAVVETNIPLKEEFMFQSLEKTESIITIKRKISVKNLEVDHTIANEITEMKSIKLYPSFSDTTFTLKQHCKVTKSNSMSTMQNKDFSAFDYIFSNYDLPIPKQSYFVGYARFQGPRDCSVKKDCTICHKDLGGSDVPHDCKCPNSSKLGACANKVERIARQCMGKCGLPLCEDKGTLPPKSDRILLKMADVCSHTQVFGKMAAKMKIGELPCECTCECFFDITKKTTYCGICGGFETPGEDWEGKKANEIFPCPIFHNLVETKSKSDRSVEFSDSRRKDDVTSPNRSKKGKASSGDDSSSKSKKSSSRKKNNKSSKRKESSGSTDKKTNRTSKKTRNGKRTQNSIELSTKPKLKSSSGKKEKDQKITSDQDPKSSALALYNMISETNFKKDRKRDDKRFQFNYAYKTPHVGHSNCDLPCDGVRIEPIPKGKGWRWDLSQPGVKRRGITKPGTTSKAVKRNFKIAKNPEEARRRMLRSKNKRDSTDEDSTAGGHKTGKNNKKGRKTKGGGDGDSAAGGHKRGKNKKKGRKTKGGGDGDSVSVGKRRKNDQRPFLKVHKKSGDYEVTMENIKPTYATRTFNQFPYEDKRPLSFCIGRTDEENKLRQKLKDRAKRRLEREQRAFIQDTFKDMCKEICIKTYQQALGILPDAEDPDCTCEVPREVTDHDQHSCSCSDAEDMPVLDSETDSDEWILEFTPPTAKYDPNYKPKKQDKTDHSTQYTYLDYKVKLLDKSGKEVPRYFIGPDGKKECSDLGGFWSPERKWLVINKDGFIAPDGRWAPFHFKGPDGDRVDVEDGKIQLASGDWLVVGKDGFVDATGRWCYYKKRYEPFRKNVPVRKGATMGRGDNKQTADANKPSEKTKGHGQDKKLLATWSQEPLASASRAGQPQAAQDHFSKKPKPKTPPKPARKGVAVNDCGQKCYFVLHSGYNRKTQKERLIGSQDHCISLSSFHTPGFSSFVGTALLRQQACQGTCRRSAEGSMDDFGVIYGQLPIWK